MDTTEHSAVIEAEGLVASGFASGTTWDCPCGVEPPSTGQTTMPVRTIVSTREPWCPFCKRPYEERLR
jgi:hypothetical protein